MRKIISLICLLLPALVFAAQPDTRPELHSDAPDRHIVVKGDTLWDISGKFFKDPWRWPYIWGMNKDTIKDPHWIYPGDIIILDRTTGTLRVGQTGGPSGDVIRLSPRAREGRSDHDAIPSIPANIIAPFLSQPLVIEEDALKDAPTLIGAREGRVMLSVHDTGFAKGLTAGKGSRWQIYRPDPDKVFTDPDTKEVLGIEAIYLGNAEVKDFADVSTVVITRSVREIKEGDRLFAPSGNAASAYLPRAPDGNISAHVISVYGGVSQAGQNAVITLSKGKRDGLESGHVLALYRKGEPVKHEGKEYTLPPEHYGLIFVFRVFDKVSYALVMQAHLPVQLLDRAQTP